MGLVFAVLGTVVWVGVGLSVQSGAGTGALSLFLAVVLGFLALLGVSWRSRASESLAGRWQWWMVGGLVCARVAGLIAAAAGLQTWVTIAATVELAGAAWLVTSAPSGRGVSPVLVLEVLLALLFAMLASLHGSGVAWMLMGFMALVRLLATADLARGNLFLAVFVVLLADAVQGRPALGGLGDAQSIGATLAPAWPLFVLSWAVALGLPRRVRRWRLLPELARRLCRGIPMLVALAIASCGLLLWQHGHVSTIVASVLALVLCAMHQTLRVRDERRFEIAPDGMSAAVVLAREAVRLHLQRILGERGRSDSTCTVLMVDVDRFTAFNLRYGTETGDEVLERVGDTLQSSLMRAGDQVARWREDCFLVVLPNTSAAHAPVVAQRLLRAVQDLGIGHAATDSGVVTVSIGVASRPAWRRQRVGPLLRDADAALQRAKGDGRNRWESDVAPVASAARAVAS
ncbi:GGDEF domain-containing protein [Pseudoxanthomonas sp. GM95]|uniref:GGDEF domain-containing protein n=1 Tax=Pseudoxanthomonas sp. GM95 TaxID=1881043 RepID=UPI001587BB9A|nr:GGDEF domain-containing protein [Pseudoxanthomonas sp. GM95]